MQIRHSKDIIENLFKLVCGGSLGWCACGTGSPLLFFPHLRDLVVPSLPYRQEISSLRFRSAQGRGPELCIFGLFLCPIYLFFIYFLLLAHNPISISLSLDPEAVLGHVFSYCQARPGTPLPPNPLPLGSDLLQKQFSYIFLSLVFKFI
jgi:hypothetical protein